MVDRAIEQIAEEESAPRPSAILGTSSAKWDIFEKFSQITKFYKDTKDKLEQTDANHKRKDVKSVTDMLFEEYQTAKVLKRRIEKGKSLYSAGRSERVIDHKSNVLELLMVGKYTSNVPLTDAGPEFEWGNVAKLKQNDRTAVNVRNLDQTSDGTSQR